MIDSTCSIVSHKIGLFKLSEGGVVAEIVLRKLRPGRYLTTPLKVEGVAVVSCWAALFFVISDILSWLNALVEGFHTYKNW